MGDFDPKHILEKYQNGTANDVEKRWVEGWWFAYKSGDSDIYIPKDPMDSARIGDEMFAEIVDKTRRNARRERIFRRTAIAASFLFLIGSVGFWLSLNVSKVEEASNALTIPPIVPGGNKAMIIFDNGTALSLDENKSTVIVGDQITYEDGSELYDLNDFSERPANEHPELVQYITMAIPRGGQYNLVLPDGSRVWLNSASTLRYPTSFTGGTRTVDLVGEAFFEVARNEDEPFLVKTNNQTVEVLGTAFNISAYAGDNRRRTTLLSGAVKVYLEDEEDNLPIEGTERMLKPGQQAVAGSSTIQVRNVDVDRVIGWKNGYMIFENESLPMIMEKAKRWYANLEVNFVGNPPSRRFNGGIPRDAPFEDFLKVLELNGIKFRVQGFTLYILN